MFDFDYLMLWKFIANLLASLSSASNYHHMYVVITKEMYLVTSTNICA